jgi:hypothetical protein
LRENIFHGCRQFNPDTSSAAVHCIIFCVYVYIDIILFFHFLWLCNPVWAMASSFTRFRDHKRRRATVSRTPLDKWSTHSRDPYLTTHNRQTSMPPVGFQPTIAEGEQP